MKILEYQNGSNSHLQTIGNLLNVELWKLYWYKNVVFILNKANIQKKFLNYILNTLELRLKFFFIINYKYPLTD